MILIFDIDIDTDTDIDIDIERYIGKVGRWHKFVMNSLHNA